MSDSTPFGFGKFVPGFDFLQNLASSAVKGAASQGGASMPGLGHWIAPTLNPEELDKRIQELKAVQFWLEQNSRALSATIQALEVQKMTLATLKGMNFSVSEVAKAFQIHPTSAAAAPAPAPSTPPAEPAAKPQPATPPAPAAAAEGEAAPTQGVVDPVQWWGALTQQFQQIASQALQDAAASASAEPGRNLAADLTRQAFDAAAKTVEGAVAAVATPAAAREAPSAAPAAPAAKKTAPRKKAAPAKRAKP